MNPLADLKDIHVPSSLGWWPPAYGWWLLTLIVLSLVIWLLIFSIKRYRHNQPKRQAFVTLATINHDTKNWPLELNSLLKRVVQTYQPDLAVQSLFGDTWLDCLTQALPTNKQPDFKQKMYVFQQALYQAQPAVQLDFTEYKSAVADWIKNAKLSGKQSHQRFIQWDQANTAQGGSDV